VVDVRLRQRFARHGAGDVALVAVLAVIGASAACTGDGPSARPAQGAASASPDSARPAHTVVQPGRPGEPAETLPPDATVPGTKWNAADVEFVQMMIPHHAQALRMCALARTRADDPQVAAVARRIDAAQAPEILALSSWLQDRGLPVPSVPGAGTDPDGSMHHRHGSQHGAQHDGAGMQMPGMLSAAQMRALAEASGPRFDRLFLADMIRHHSGAVTMAEQVAVSGSDLRVSEIAAEVATEQRAEIDRMRTIRAKL
jgi:uncharacterized protein (DUF305 family)